MFLGRQWLGGGGGGGQEILDTPLSNFDIIGVPTQAWSSGFFSGFFCCENVVPSCLLSIFCPCLVFSQVIVRAQIPLFIGIKNSIDIFRGKSGFGAFIDYFNVSVILSVTLLLLITLVELSSLWKTFFSLLLIIVFLQFASASGHLRTAFKEKYQLPGLFPPGSEVFDMFCDIPVSVCCMPCSLSQMMRHLFQYDTLDTPLGLYMSDPSSLPPLRPTPTDEEASIAGMGGGIVSRPARADTAGLFWQYDTRHPDRSDQSGTAHRQEELRRRQEAQLFSTSATPIPSAPLSSSRPATSPIPSISADPVPTTAIPYTPYTPYTVMQEPRVSDGDVYNADGSRAQR